MSYSNFKSFSNMAVSLRVGAASGMDTAIKLEPESAIALAEILEMYGEACKDSLKESLQNISFDKESSGG